VNIDKQKGSSTVEFVLVLPILLLLVVMVAALGIRFYRLNAVTKSVQIAARYLSEVSINNTNTATDVANAQKLAVYGNITSTGTPVASGFTTANITVTDLGDHVRVVASYSSALPGMTSLNTIMNLATGGSAPDIMTLRAASVMRFAQ
jgi:Flp pilus assembly protein TadG